jgi:hypothetical protein
MRWLSALLLFVMAFLAGAALFLVSRPAPVIRAMVLELRGPGLIARCRQAGACAKLDIAPQPPQQPAPRKMAPTDMDRG